MPKYACYAVIKNGQKTIVTTWEDCFRMTNKIKGVRFKGFESQQEADVWGGEYISKSGIVNETKRPKPSRTEYPEQLKVATEQKHAIMYTDAAFLREIKFAGAGIYSETFGLNDHERLDFNAMTNQRAELYAVAKALKYYEDNYKNYCTDSCEANCNKHHSGLTLFTDSNWSVNTLTVFPKTWERKRREHNVLNLTNEQETWVTKSGKEPKHLDIIVPTLNLIEKLREDNHTINIYWIPRELNTKADALSRGVVKV
jgi:ribonuclease HI